MTACRSLSQAISASHEDAAVDHMQKDSPQTMVYLLKSSKMLAHIDIRDDSTSALAEEDLIMGPDPTHFAYIDGRLQLETLHLNDLWESRLIQFLGVSGESHISPPGGPTWLNRTTLDWRSRTRYGKTRGRFKNSTAVDKLIQNIRFLYGPPGRSVAAVELLVIQ
nr:hypothetical protein CFP56_04558 [Quercus suber]